MEAFSVPKEYAEKLRELGFGFGGKLSPMEVIFLNEFGIAPVYSERVEELRERYRWEYEVYKDLRIKGYIVRPSPEEKILRVYRKGYRPEEDRTLYLLRIVEPGEEIGKAQLMEDLEKAGSMKKELVYAFAGSPVRYVSISRKVFP